MTVAGMWIIKIQGVGELLLTCNTDGSLVYAHRGNGLWDSSWGPPQEAEKVPHE
jgi:hypothetical protein